MRVGTKTKKELAAEEAARKRDPVRWAISDRRAEILGNGVEPLPSTEPQTLRNLVTAATQLGEKIKGGSQIAIGFAVEKLDRKARKAWRAGYGEHHLVREWQEGRRSLGETKALRALKNNLRGTAAGVSKQTKLTDIWLIAAVAKIKTECKSAPTLAKIQKRARELNDARWLPEIINEGLVHEDVDRMQMGRKFDKDALIMELRAARRRLKEAIGKRLKMTPRAFANWMAGLGLHEPRIRRR